MTYLQSSLGPRTGLHGTHTIKSKYYNSLELVVPDSVARLEAHNVPPGACIILLATTFCICFHRFQFLILQPRSATIEPIGKEISFSCNTLHELSLVRVGF